MAEDRFHLEASYVELSEAELSTVSAGDKHTSPHLKLEGIDGESTDKGSKNGIEISSF